MKKFLERLNEERIKFENMELRKYDKKAMPEVLSYLQAIKKNKKGALVYNSEAENFIIKVERLEDMDEVLKDHLGTEVYLAQKDMREIEQEEHRKEMIAKGYLPLDSKVKYRGPVEFVGKVSMDWMSSKVSNVGKIITAGNGEPFIVPKGKRSRGWYARTLEDAFYKPINK